MVVVLKYFEIAIVSLFFVQFEIYHGEPEGKKSGALSITMKDKLTIDISQKKQYNDEQRALGCKIEILKERNGEAIQIYVRNVISFRASYSNQPFLNHPLTVRAINTFL